MSGWRGGNVGRRCPASHSGQGSADLAAARLNARPRPRRRPRRSGAAWRAAPRPRCRCRAPCSRSRTAATGTSCSSGTYFAASSMRRLRSSFDLELAELGRHQAEDDGLALGQEAQRLEVARARVVVLEEVAVDVHLREQRLGDRLVAALRRPGALEVAAAQVHGERHALGLLRDDAVDERRRSGAAARRDRRRASAPPRASCRRTGRRGWCRPSARRCSRRRRASAARRRRRWRRPRRTARGRDSARG